MKNYPQIESLPPYQKLKLVHALWDSVDSEKNQNQVFSFLDDYPELLGIFECSVDERIELAMHLWDFVPKNDVELSDGLKQELDFRIQKEQDGELRNISYEEAKNRWGEQSE